MEKNQPLGPLAHAILEQFGDLTDNAVVSAVERHRAKANVASGGRDVLGHVYSDLELAGEPLRPGNWVTVGAIWEGGAATLVEFNLRTWEAREFSAV